MAEEPEKPAGPKRRWTERSGTLALLHAFIRHPARIGAVAPSSADLARAMVSGLSLAPHQTIVEFGPGTGPFTAKIRGILPRPACYLGIEIDPRLASLLRERYPELRVVEGSAAHAERHLAEAGRSSVRAVICGIPFATLSPAVQDAVIRAFDGIVGPGGEVRTFQYVHAFPMPAAVRFRRRMDSLFGPHTRVGPLLRNLPPAYVLRWTR
jgi:phosphatidylethanolamine/phosphatidyl-N-methylethanolamine N-methyltransferase